MHFSATFLAAAAALASFVSANTVDFVNQDGTERTIYFTGQEGQSAIKSLDLKGHATATQSFPNGWIGNAYAVPKGAANEPGMLAEFRWNGFAGANYFDVSAIVNPNDNNNVKIIHPKVDTKNTSGCQSFPCANAYNAPNDIQTQSTQESNLVCLIGNVGGKMARAFNSRVNRAFITQ